MALTHSELSDMIKEAFPGADFRLEDLKGDGEHYALTITSSTFAGKTRIQQHQMVYAALQGKMGDELHALAVTTKIPN